MSEVTIKFSRHAKRRAKLYRISEETVKQAIEQTDLAKGKQEIVKEVPGLTYPLKIVISLDGKVATVVTTYPLKKRATR